MPLCPAAVSTVAPPGPEHVLVVANANSRDSLVIAHHYVARRGIAAEQLVTLDCPAQETITREVFDRTVHWPLLRHLARTGLGERIRFIVTTGGVPLRVAGDGRSLEVTTQASVDSELTLLRWELTHPRALPPLEGPLRNPYFGADPAFTGAGRFDPRRWPIYLVTRLAGFSVADVRRMIAQADVPGPRGVFAIDLRAAPHLPGGDDALRLAAARLRALGCEVHVEETPAVLSGLTGLSGYASWGSNDPHRTTRHFDLGFLPGAIACPLVSTDARTFVPPPASWDLVGWEDTAHFYAGSPQTLTGDLVAAGVTGVSGNVWEPTYALTARPEIALPAYAAGHSLAEAFYQALPAISWQAVIVGDPLARLRR